jgi:hypothetical protein
MVRIMPHLGILTFVVAPTPMLKESAPYALGGDASSSPPVNAKAFD